MAKEAKDKLRSYKSFPSWKDMKGYFSSDEKLYFCMRVSYSSLSESEIMVHFSNLVTNYHAMLKNAGSDQFLMFKAIVRLATSLNRLHPHHDGNTRIFVTILLNRELIKHGFHPIILVNPNLFDPLAQSELGLEVLKGMENYAFVKKYHLYPNTDSSLSTGRICEYISACKEKGTPEGNINIKPLDKGLKHMPFRTQHSAKEAIPPKL